MLSLFLHDDNATNLMRTGEGAKTADDGYTDEDTAPMTKLSK